MERFIFGSFEYSYELIKQKRKTLSLTVTPELKIILKCPIEADAERRDVFLRRKWFWMEKQLRFFKKYRRNKYKREYVSGESFLYLGRQYRLLIRKGEKNRAILTGKKIVIFTKQSTPNNQLNKIILNEWLNKRITLIFPERVFIINNKFGFAQQPTLIIKRMSKRWGSFLKSNKIVLNPKLIGVPKDCIDYVITHELCHSKYKNHDKNFFRLLEQKYPNWKKTKEKLELIGSAII